MWQRGGVCGYNCIANSCYTTGESESMTETGPLCKNITFTVKNFQFSRQVAFEKGWAHSPLRAVLHCHSPGVATVARCHCRTPPAHRCRQRRRQRQHVTEGTAMAPWNGPNYFRLNVTATQFIVSARHDVLVCKSIDSLSHLCPTYLLI